MTENMSKINLNKSILLACYTFNLKITGNDQGDDRKVLAYLSNFIKFIFIVDFVHFMGCFDRSYSFYFLSYFILL